MFPTQVITTNRLTAESHTALKVLTTNARREDVRAFLTETQGMKNQGDRDRADAILQVSVSANKELYRAIYEGEPEMCQAEAARRAGVSDSGCKKNAGLTTV